MPSRFRELLYSLLMTGLASAVSVVIFDCVAYRLISPDAVSQFPDYRTWHRPSGFAGRNAYPFDYFVAHDRRGFDMGRDRQARHWVEGETFDIWSNSLGCYDSEPDRSKRYVYLVGDSFTWGYAPYDSKFGTLLERSTGWTVYKCGVTHSGQLHQLDKLLEIQALVGTRPVAMLVFWYFNDIANDRYYPHSTVVDGWQVDDVQIEQDGTPVRIDRGTLTKQVQERLRAIDSQRGRPEYTLRDSLLQYSIVFNLLRWIKQAVFSNPFSIIDREATVASAVRKNLHDVELIKDGRVFYSDNPIAERNKAALLALGQTAAEFNSMFAVLLIPIAQRPFDIRWHSEVKEFLDDNKIMSVDLAGSFIERGEDVDSLFLLDGHLSRYGNAVVAQILEEKFGDLIKSQLAETPTF
jgi:hypothetical protein